MRRNRPITWIVGTALLLIPACQWAKWNEVRQGPQVKTADAVGGLYVRIGMGKWTDATGRVHVQPVYVRTDEVGPKGERGPTGQKGAVGEVTVTLDRPVDLEKLRDPNATYDAKAGTYKRKIEVVTPIWQSNPASVFKDVQPLKEKGDTLPSWDARRGRLGETEGGGFLGGGFEAATDVAQSGTGVMFVFGSLAVIGGGLLWWASKNWKLGLAVMGGGLLLIFTAFTLVRYPWLPLVIIVAAVGVGIWFLLDAKAGAKAKSSLAATQTALSAVVAGVENAKVVVLPSDKVTTVDTAFVKDAIKAAAGTKKAAVKATITAAKQQAGV